MTSPLNASRMKSGSRAQAQVKHRKKSDPNSTRGSNCFFSIYNICRTLVSEVHTVKYLSIVLLYTLIQNFSVAFGKHYCTFSWAFYIENTNCFAFRWVTRHVCLLFVCTSWDSSFRCRYLHLQTQNLLSVSCLMKYSERVTFPVFG